MLQSKVAVTKKIVATIKNLLDINRNCSRGNCRYKLKKGVRLRCQFSFKMLNIRHKKPTKKHKPFKMHGRKLHFEKHAKRVYT